MIEKRKKEREGEERRKAWERGRHTPRSE